MSSLERPPNARGKTAGREVGLAEGGGSRGFAPGKWAVKSAPNERAAARGSLALDDIAVSELSLSDFAQPAPLFVRLRNRDDAFLAVNRHRRIQCGRTASQILEKLARGRTLHERRLGRLPFRLSPADRQ